MKSSHIITESSLTYVVILYYQKNYPFIKHFKKMVIEMLLNIDIKKKIN
jgi:hypothetical protein